MSSSHQRTPGSRRVRSCLFTLENWIADAAADAAWGPPVDTADLNRPWTVDVVELPEGVEACQRLVVAHSARVHLAAAAAALAEAHDRKLIR